MGCAWIANELLKSGFIPESSRTEELIEIWSSKKAETIARGKSADYLRRTGQEEDLFFVLNHLDDLDLVAKVRGDEVVSIPPILPGSVRLRKAVAPGRTQQVSAA